MVVWQDGYLRNRVTATAEQIYLRTDEHTPVSIANKRMQKVIFDSKQLETEFGELIGYFLTRYKSKQIN